MPRPHDPDRSLASAARLIGAVVLVLSTASFAGWALDVDALQRPFPRAAAMAPLTAVVLVALATTTLLLAARDRAGRDAARALALLAAGVGLVRLVDVTLAVDIALNRRLFGSDERMATTTAVAVLLLGIALAFLDAHDRRREVARLAAVGALALGAAGVIGFLLGVEFFFSSGRSMQMAPQSAVCVTLLSAGALLLRPGVRTRVLLGPSLGGRFARTFLPLVVLILLGSSALAAQGVRSEWWSISTAAWIIALVSIAALVGLVVWAAMRLHEEDERRAADERALQRLATRDPLTGAYNRRAFDAEFERAVERAQRYGDGVAVCVIDLDHFKQINDLHGHAAGDDALVRVYRALRSRLRTTDVLGRIGGDEFAAVLTHVDEAAAHRIAHEMAATVRGVGSELADEGLHNVLSASIGVALHGEGTTASDLVRLADERMYVSKRASRAA